MGDGVQLLDPTAEGIEAPSGAFVRFGGGRQIAIHDQAKHIGLGQNARLLRAAKAVDDGVAFHHPTAMLLHGVGRIRKAKGFADVLANEQRFAVLVGHDADRFARPHTKIGRNLSTPKYEELVALGFDDTRKEDAMRSSPAETPAPSARPKIDTAEMAAKLRVNPQTPRSGLWRDGHYLGMRPVKLPNGRLLWDEATVDRLTAGEVAGAVA